MNKRDMVALIKKRAQDLADPPGVNTSKPKVPNVPQAPEGGTIPVENLPRVQGPSPDIIKMQTALTNLARTVTSEIGASALAAPKPGQSQDPEAQKEAAGRLAFSNFITEHYINQSDVPAVEYDPNPAKTQMSEKDPSKAKRMNTVMDTMSRVGGSKNEFKVDGNWGPRTNAALRNSYALGFALLKMATDFHFEPHSYDASELAKLKQLTPLDNTSISPAEKIKRSKEIVPQLRAITNLFNEVKTHILQKPANRAYIEGTQSYATYQKNEASTTPSTQVVDDLNKKFTNMKVSGANADGKPVSVPITVSDLITPQTLQLWQQKNLPKVPLENIISQIKKHLDETDVSKGAV